MKLRPPARRIAACTGVLAGLLAIVLVRRVAAPPVDPARVRYLELRRARMQSARAELIGARPEASS